MRSSRSSALLMVAALAVTAPAVGAQAAEQAVVSARRAPLALGAAELVTDFAPADEESDYPYAIAVADGAGVTTAVWTDRGLRAAQRNRAGSWGAPVTVGSCPSTSRNCVVTYSLVTDLSGNVTAAWDQSDNGAIRTYVASLPRGGRWTAPYLVARSPGGGGPVLSTGRNGAVLLTYPSWNRTTGDAVNALYKPPGAAWSAARRRTFAHVKHPVSGISDSGVAVIVARGIGRADNRLRSYRYRPGVGWSRGKRLGIAMHYDIAPYSLAMGGGGRAVLAYMYDPHSSFDVVGKPVLRARVMNRQGRWGRPRPLSGPGAVGSEVPLVTIRGTASVLWTTTRGAVREARQTPGHPWRVSTAYPRGSGDVLQVDRNARGDLALLIEQWRRGPRLFAGVRSSKSGWSGRVRIPDTTGEISAFGCVVAMPDGSGLVLTNDVHSGPTRTYRTLARTLTPVP